MKKLYLSGMIFGLILSQIVFAQSSGPFFSASYDFYPYTNLADPDPGFLEDVKIRVATLKLKATYPMPVSQTMLLSHELLYDRFDMDYRNWDQTYGKEIPHGHAVKYNLMIMKLFSEKWSMLAFITPGLASDFRSKLSKDDITIEVACILIYKLSESLSLGGGLAYSRQFGEPMPLPVLAFDWNNGSNIRARAIIPANLEFWYMMGPKFELGLVLEGDGNEYHGDPDRYGGDNPKMKYSVMTFGPSLKYHFSETISFHADAGYAFLRRFEFTNDFGNQEVEDKLDLKNSTYVRIGIQVGGG